MKLTYPTRLRSRRQQPDRAASAFTLIELLVVVGIIAVLATLLGSSLIKARAKAAAIQCLSNERQLNFAALIYTDDHDGSLPYNLGSDEIKRLVARGEYINWTSSIMSWELDADNTNTMTLTRGGIGAETCAESRIYRCPSDRVVSDVQAAAGWTHRVRSYSMNAMIGDAGEYTRSGFNVNNPSYSQFFKVDQILQPSKIFVFIEEHPDSINDGYFVNKPETLEWNDLPASPHNGSANFSYVDGHIEPYYWRFASTKPAPKPDAANLPFAVPSGQRSDFYWLMSRMSFETRYTER